MINIHECPNGNLVMFLSDENDKDMIREWLEVASSESEAESIFIAELLDESNTSNGKTYTQIAPEEVGALTCAPLITDGENVWGYMDYSVKSLLSELLAGREIVWEKG